jgi:nucleolar protein 15
LLSNLFLVCTNYILFASLKTGNSRGYAFIEFKNKEVAEIAAEAMDNYLIYNRLLKGFLYF